MKKTYISLEWGDTRTRFARLMAIKKAKELAEKRAAETKRESARRAA